MHIMEVRQMRATLNIPDKLIDEVQRLSGQKSKTQAIVTVMEDYVRRKKMEDLLALRGKITIDYDWEREEAAELKAAEAREEYGAK
jgi:metal-responsive CopG/Arc/MetJ family transcriptional regulator